MAMSAEPIVAQADSRGCRGAKPTPFRVMTLLVAAHAMLSFAYWTPGSHFNLAAAIIALVCMVYFFWRQKSWARLCVLMTAAASLVVDVFKFFRLSILGQIVIGVHLALAAFLMYWLNTRSAKGYFTVGPLKNDAEEMTG
jgi:hypothetical protein